MSFINPSNIARSEGDPKVQRKGPSSLTGPDRLARALGWFSIGLGITELVAPGRIARTLGLEGKEGLIRAYGAREIGGDALDLGTLALALRPDNPKRHNAAIATAMVIGITLLDIFAYSGTKAVHSRERGRQRDYSDRSGLPRGAHASRGAARSDFRTPPDYKAEGTVADAIPRSVPELVG